MINIMICDNDIKYAEIEKKVVWKQQMEDRRRYG